MQNMSVVIYFFEKPCLLRFIDESTHDNCFILQKAQINESLPNSIVNN